jgi:hypothetical protein
MRLGGAAMAFGLDDPGTHYNGLRSAQVSPDGSLAWYMVVGIEFVLFAAILVPVICGALLAR